MRLPLWVHQIGQVTVVGLLFFAVTAAIWAAPPSITSAALVDIHYDPADPGQVQYAYRIQATDTPTAYAAASLPPDAVVNASTGWINGNRNTPGTYDVLVRAENAEGAGTALVRFAIHPAVVGVAAQGGTYAAGQQVKFTLHYNTAVTVSGAPRLALMVGPGDSATLRQASYVSGSGTADLVFAYTVAQSDQDPDGVQVLPSAPQGGAIREVTGLEASPTLPVKYFSSGVTITGGLAATPGGTSSAPAVAGRLANVSARLRVAEGDGSRSLITGFAIQGTAARRMLLRGVGPALADFGVKGALADPRLSVYAANGSAVATNDNWAGTEVRAAAESVGAFGLAEGARDAATVVTLSPGVYTLSVAANGGDGVALAEVYDIDSAAGTELSNLSTRGRVEAGDGALIAGFAIKGETGRRVLVRGVGPALTAFGVADALDRPVLKVYQGDQLIAQNDGWENTASPTELSATSAAAGAFALPVGGKDAALAVTLAPGSYTAVVSGANGLGGTALVEVYEVP